MSRAFETARKMTGKTRRQVGFAIRRQTTMAARPTVILTRLKKRPQKIPSDQTPDPLGSGK